MTADRSPIHRVPIGSGTPEGTNSAYVLADRHVVVDPGPPTDRAWADLRAGVERAGLAIDDVEYVLVTHWHADHAGLAPRLADEAGATIAMGAADAPIVGEYAIERDRRLERDAATMRRWGVPTVIAEDVVACDRPSPVPDSFPVTPLADGDEVAGLEAIATPGHTTGHAAFAIGEDLLVGDAVLPTYTPNVGGSDTRSAGSDPLGTYLRTLDRLADRPEAFRPGHGASIDPDRLAAIRSHHGERSRRVLEAIDRLGKATPWAVARDLFGDLEGIHVKFGAGEAAAHLERLERADRVDRIDDEPSTYAPNA